MAQLQLDAEVRTITGRKVKQLRRQGLVPVVVYGNNQAGQSLQIEERPFERILRLGGTSQLIEVNVAGQETLNVLVRDLQLHPVKRSIIHADLYAVNLKEKQQVSVSITSTGRSESESSVTMVLQVMDSIMVEALPTDIPMEIECDITVLSMENALTVDDLPALEGVEYLSEPDEMVFNMVAVRTATVDEVESEEVIEGAVTEPEVMSKGKSEDEDA